MDKVARRCFLIFRLPPILVLCFVSGFVAQKFPCSSPLSFFGNCSTRTRLIREGHSHALLSPLSGPKTQEWIGPRAREVNWGSSQSVEQLQEMRDGRSIG